MTEYIYPITDFKKTGLYVFKKYIGHYENFNLKLFADTRFKLYINDTYIGEGPCQGAENEHYFEEFNVSDFLNNELNEIKVYVLHILHDGFTTVFSGDKALLWAEGYSDGEKVIKTDESWDIFRLDGVDYKNGDIVAKFTAPFEYHHAVKEYVPLKTAVGKKLLTGNSLLNDNGIIDEITLSESPLPQMYLSEWKSFNTDKFTENGCILDAGYYTTAKVKIKACGKKGDTLKLTYAECYMKKTADGLIFKKRRDDNTGFLEGPSDYIELNGETQEIELWWYRAFRYIQISCDDFEKLDIELLYADTHYPYNIIGSFECSNDYYNKMWQISIQTLKCCSHEILIDCPFFEQQQYAMDSYLQSMYLLKICNDLRMPKKVISELAQSQLNNGLLRANYPSRYIQIIPTFSIYWLMLLYDYYFYSGDRAFVSKFIGTADKMLWSFQLMLNEKGLLKSTYWPFTDWTAGWINGVPENGLKEPITVYSMQYSTGLKYAEALAEAIGRSELACEYKKRRLELNTAIDKYLWNEEKQYYNDTFKTEKFSRHTAVWAILSEIKTGEDAVRLFKRSNDLSSADCSFSMSFFLNRALEKIGSYEKSFSYYENFKNMIDMGCTTWCEDPINPRSECHAWSSTPLYEFSVGILGVKQTEVGFKKVLISPECGELSYAKGNVPTPYGNIYVEWKKENGTVKVKYSAPKEIDVTLDEKYIFYEMEKL